MLASFFWNQITWFPHLPTKYTQNPTRTCPPSRYQYIALNEAAQEIRLLTLHPGSLSDPIRASLQNTPFMADNVPVFEALSYTWGCPSYPPKDFRWRLGLQGPLGHSQSVRSLAISSILGQTRALWIDAICVNQQDFEERSQQVKRMAEIYSRTSKVLVWLGYASELTSVAIECLKEIVSHVELDCSNYRMIARTAERSWANEDVPLPFGEDGMLGHLRIPWLYMAWAPLNSPRDLTLTRWCYYAIWTSRDRMEVFPDRYSSPFLERARLEEKF